MRLIAAFLLFTSAQALGDDFSTLEKMATDFEIAEIRIWMLALEGDSLNYHPPSAIKENSVLEMVVTDRALASFIVGAMQITRMQACQDPKEEQMVLKMRVKSGGRSHVFYLSEEHAWNGKFSQCARVAKETLRTLYPLSVDNDS